MLYKEKYIVFKEYKDEKEFLAENEEYLMANEDINNTMLGIIPHVDKEKFFFRIENNNSVELIGIITKTERQGLVIFIKDYNTSIDLYEFLVDEIISRKIVLKEIKAHKGIADIIFNYYNKKMNINEKSRRTLYLMKLKNFKNKIIEKDSIRKATLSDLEFETSMAHEISLENFGKKIPNEKAEQIAKNYIEKGLYFLTNDSNEILSQAVTTKTRKNGYTIGVVYTPKDKRRKGYAKECLYRIIKQIKSENKNVIVLYSNVEKGGNKKLYESLGFEIILEETIIEF